MSNHVDSLFAAVSELAGHGNIKQRLMLAYEQHVVGIQSDDLPLHLSGTLSELRERMTCVEPINGEGPVCASVRKMSVDEACECAAVVVRLYGDMIRYQDDAQEMLPLQVNGHNARMSSAKQLVPPFLVKSARLRSG
ncbi:MAG TPA: hypothetical protein VLB07_01665 [Woeseiaceae bacterium]|nr:hypothetical protein [Woeseiaceae bacterium]